uniref:Uncharacterized protein n=1 Tax=Arundo donax TaxID=35708 RepID=A0A0A9FCD8_ARUDO
MGRSSRGLFP